MRALRIVNLQAIVFHRSYRISIAFLAVPTHFNHCQQIPHQFTLFSISFSLTFIITTYLLTSSLPSCPFLFVGIYLWVCPLLLVTLSLVLHFHPRSVSLSFFLLFSFWLLQYPNHPLQSPPCQEPSLYNALTPFRNFILSPPVHQRAILFKCILIYCYSFILSVFLSLSLLFFRHVFIQSESPSSNEIN